MTLNQILLSPNGRIGPRHFLRGVVVLLAIAIVNQVLSVYGGLAYAPVSLILSLVLLYGYICVYGKRLHDRGLSAWLFILVFIAYVILDAIIQSILAPILAPRAEELQLGLADMIDRGQWEDAVVFMRDLAREVLFTALLSILAVNAIFAFAMSRLGSDPGRNQHGDPPNDASNPFS